MRIAFAGPLALLCVSLGCGPESISQPGGGGAGGRGSGGGSGSSPPACDPDHASCDASAPPSGCPPEFASCDAGAGPDASCNPGEFGSCDAGPDVPPPPMLCQPGGVNNEPEILVGYLPASGQTVTESGQIKVWVNDECAPTIAPNEQVDLMTGAIITPGDRTATAPDGYLWEPALYIAPQSAENGGTPHFPSFIKGKFTNNPAAFPFSCFSPVNGAPIDPPPPGSSTPELFTAEYIWNVSSLGLPPGTYQAEFVIHDGDTDRGVGCIVLIITQ